MANTGNEINYQCDIETRPLALQWPNNDHQQCILEPTKTFSFLLIKIRTDQSFHASESNKDDLTNLIPTLQWALLPELHWNPAIFITVTHTSSLFTLGHSSQKIFVWLLLGPYARAQGCLGLTSSRLYYHCDIDIIPNTTLTFQWALLPIWHRFLSPFVTMVHNSSGIYYHCDIEMRPLSLQWPNNWSSNMHAWMSQPTKCGMKLLVYSQTSSAVPLELGNG